MDDTTDGTASTGSSDTAGGSNCYLRPLLTQRCFKAPRAHDAQDTTHILSLDHVFLNVHPNDAAQDAAQANQRRLAQIGRLNLCGTS